MNIIIMVNKVGFGFYWLARALLMFFLVMFPFQIGVLVYNEPFLVTGNFNSYSAFFIYFSDILLISSFLFFAISYFAHEKVIRFSPGDYGFTILLFLFVLSLASTFLYSSGGLGIFFAGFRLFELLLLYFLLSEKILSLKETVFFLLYGVFIQVIIVLMQYISQSSIGLSFLGEPEISSAIPGVAKIDFEGVKMVRPYGTFPHPNVLGGFMMLMLGWVFLLFRTRFSYLFISVILVGAGLIFSFSRSALLAVVTAFFIFFSLNEVKIPWRIIMIFLSSFVFLIVLFNLESLYLYRLFDFFGSSALLERIDYNEVAVNMFLENPFGVGFGQFTNFMQDFSLEKFAPWTMQPVHNVYLLVLAEGGIIAGLLLLSLIVYTFYKLLSYSGKVGGNLSFNIHLLTAQFFGLVVLFLFDHYFLTLYQGQILLIIFFALVSGVLGDMEKHVVIAPEKV